MSGRQDLADFIDFGIKGGVITEADRGPITANWDAMRAAIPELDLGCCGRTTKTRSAQVKPRFLVIGVPIPLRISGTNIRTEVQHTSSGLRQGGEGHGDSPPVVLCLSSVLIEAMVYFHNSD